MSTAAQKFAGISYWGNGYPKYWMDEQTTLKPAMQAFFNAATGEGAVTQEQLDLVAAYAQYVINAPCWDANPYMEDDGKAELAQLRERSRTLASVESIKRWIAECMDIGIDPF